MFLTLLLIQQSFLIFFSEIKLIDYLQKKYNFSDDFRRRLHDKITKKGYDKKKIEEIIRKLLGLD